MRKMKHEPKNIIFGSIILLTLLYLLLFFIVPNGFVIRTWYRGIGLAVIMLWQAIAILFAVKKRKVAIWLCSVFAFLLLMLAWLVAFFKSDLEYVNDNGTITVVESTGFMQESEYTLWEKKGSLYRKYIRKSFSREDIDPNSTKEQFLKENYPELYENMMNYKNRNTEDVTENSISEDVLGDDIKVDTVAENYILSRDEVLGMRKAVLEGMSDEEIERLTENIKIFNLSMENAYFYDNIFDKLSDKNSLYWNYFDQKGDIQIGWAYDDNISDMKLVMENEGISEVEFYEKYCAPVMAYNRYDAAAFIELIRDMQKSVHDETLIAELQQLIDLASLAAETHEVEYANRLFKTLHDLDYFLLRYGIEDIGGYTQDNGFISTYYNTLIVYGAESFSVTR